MADNIADKVRDIIVEQLGVNPEQVTPEAKFIEDLGADSLDTVELVMAFEEEFGIDVPDEEAEKLQSVGDVISSGFLILILDEGSLNRSSIADVGSEC